MASWSMRLFSGKQPFLVLARIQEVFWSISNVIFTVLLKSLQDGPETKIDQQSPSCQGGHMRHQRRLTSKLVHSPELLLRAADLAFSFVVSTNHQKVVLDFLCRRLLVFCEPLEQLTLGRLACKPLASVRFTGDISSKLCRAGATGMFCSLNACCKPRPASEAAITELGFAHWMLWSPYALGIRTRLCFGHRCAGHHILLEYERDYALGMDALVTVCSWNTNEIMLWARLLWSPYALGIRTRLCFGHGCSGLHMLLEYERDYALDMDALVIVCSWNTNEIMLWVWMLWSPYILGIRMRLCFGYGCSGLRMLLEYERDYALGMDALVSICSWNTNEIMLWAWMRWSPYALGIRTLL